MRVLKPLLALLLAALMLLGPGLAPAAKPDFATGSKPVGLSDSPVDPPLDPAIAPPEPIAPPDMTGFEPARYGERILFFNSDILVAADGTLTVTETIRVNTEGREIRRGIYRDFPTSYRDPNRRRVRVGFRLLDVQRDGHAEPYSSERINNGRRIRIGDADVLLPNGEHTYVLRYTATRMVGFFADYDELYWNATGNGWAFPIERAEARIRLPQAVPLSRPSVYTGPQGSTAHAGEVVSQAPGDITFRTTAALGVNEGFTVAVRWQKGVIAPPPPVSPARLWVQDYGPPVAAILSLLVLGFFYYYAWKRAGRGPLPGTVVPLFEPPQGYSAAAIRYVKRMAFDNRVYAAAIVEGGVRGKLRLEEGEKGWISKAKTWIHKTAEPDDLPPPERAMLTALFAEGASVEMDKDNHKVFIAARKGLSDGLQEAYLGKLFLRNLGWAWLGLLLILTAMLFVGTVIAFTDVYAELGERLLPGTGFILLVGAVMAGIHSRLAEKEGSWALAALAILLGIGGAAFVGHTVVTQIDTEGWLVAWMAAPLLILPVALSAFVWMSAPTPEGRQVMDRIAGFQRYLSITEEDRLEALHPPEKTPELFERYLPHAIALGVENKWAGKFAGVLAAAAADPSRQGGTMGWYVGGSNVWSNPSMFASTVGSTLASSVASAATAPGSSSGSGGGGFSGGGGGGGGGGGW